MTTNCPSMRGSTGHARTSARTGALLAALAAAGCVTALPALAQQPPRAADNTETLETTVVTSGKRVEKQRELAGTVSVIPGAELERRNAKDQEDAFKLTPGVQINKGDPSNNTVTIRGLGTISQTEGGGAQQEPTGFYLEDVPLISPIGKGLVVDILPFDLERIEVLRGPQGALYGSGSLGGAIRYLYAKPYLKAFEATVQGGASMVSGGGTGHQIYGMLNAPLSSDVAALRVVGFDRKEPGYIDNLGTGTKDANEVRQTGGRVALTLKPNRDFTATLIASTQKTDKDDAFSVSPDKDKLEHTAPTNATQKSQFDFASLTMDWDIGRHTLTSITGWWKKKNRGQGDDTELFGSVGLVLPSVVRPFDGWERAHSQELRIASKPGGPLSYVAGVFYQKSKSNSAAKQIDASGAFGLTDLVDLTTDSGGTEKAAFFDGEYAFGGGWSVGLGGRYYKTTTHYKSVGFIFGAPSDSIAPDGEESGTTPKVSLKYRFGDNLWYALASKGYRYGGVNATPPFRSYKSDSLWNYETGIRLTPAAGVQFDATLFYLDWKDAQFTTFDSTGPLPFSGIDNVGKARSIGVELAARYRFTQAFDVAAAAAYIDAETTADVLDANGQPIPSGARLPGTAKLQTGLQANFRFAGPVGSQGRFNATHSYIGSRKMDLNQFKSAPGFHTLDFGLSFQRDHWTLAATLTNALDERGIMSITGAPFDSPFALYFLQRPRTLNLTLRYDY